jgi:hypothetical protein
MRAREHCVGRIGNGDAVVEEGINIGLYSPCFSILLFNIFLK